MTLNSQVSSFEFFVFFLKKFIKDRLFVIMDILHYFQEISAQ